VPIVDAERAYSFDESRAWVEASVAPLGDSYRERVRASFASRSIDVYENDGKRSGAYSAPVYGVHPYMLLNHNDTLDAVFTLAHEMGHNLHTVLAHAHQPFVYSDYTIFVAEVPSTFNEALLLEYLLARSADPRERIVLLEHAIENMAGTFFSQVLFADYELQAHRLAETDQPITAEILSQLYGQLLLDYYGNVLDEEPLAQLTWARVPHFYQSPYYVYQYATCFASAARFAEQILEGDPAAGAAAVERYLDLLKSGGSDYPMNQLQRSGVDLREPDTVEAVIERFDGLVTRLERELIALGALQRSDNVQAE
jgi:oligoendopeptidase F